MGTKFQSNVEATGSQYEALSVTTLLGEKEPLMQALNDLEHGYTSFSQFARASINLKLSDLGSEFRLTEK